MNAVLDDYDEQDDADQVYEAERGALRRVAAGMCGLEDAALLAGRLGHQDMFACVYCGREVNDGCDDPSQFSCCGEVGHTERVSDEI